MLVSKAENTKELTSTMSELMYIQYITLVILY